MIDEAHITVIGGKGGDGVVSFYPFKSGPDGGNGGKGGDVYAVVTPNITHLRKYVEKRKFEGKAGGKGGAHRRHGLDGEDIELQMPIGTIIVETQTKREALLTRENPRILLAYGGAGGIGNNAFKSPTNRTPRQMKPGEPGEERHFKLILKLIADYGFIGLPNAGKSSLLNELTAANVRTANYPFTTLEPNLGTLNDRVLADIPGLIEGASTGKGLGVKFLKHIEKVRLLLHCISVENEDVEGIYYTVRKELETYNRNLISKDEIILLTKIDLADKKDVEEKMKKLKKIHKNVLPMSIHDLDGLDALKKLIK